MPERPYAYYGRSHATMAENTTNSAEIVTEKNKAAADDVVAAMRSHGGSAAVQEMGCTALSNLCGVPLEGVTRILLALLRSVPRPFRIQKNQS